MHPPIRVIPQQGPAHVFCLTYLGPHLGDHHRNILMPDLHFGRNELRVYDMFSEQDERISRPRNMVFRTLWVREGMSTEDSGSELKSLPFSHATFYHCW